MRSQSTTALGFILAAVSIVFATACSAPSAAPAASTQTKSAPTAVAESQKTTPAATEVVSQKPTVAAEKPGFPSGGKTISLIVGANAGGPTDGAARLLAPLLEKDLGTPVQVVNRPGAGSQLSLTDIAKSKADGYTIGYISLPQVISIYLDPQRQAVFTRKDFQSLAMHVVDPGVIAVKADSPYKSLADLIGAAKAKPESVKAGTAGILSDDHLAILQLQRLTGAKMAAVHFDGGAPAITALLGNHIDAYFANASEFISHVKAGEIRLLGVMDKERSKYYPDVKTTDEQGVALVSSSSRGVAMVAGAPKQVVDTLGNSMKKAMADPDFKAKNEQAGYPLKYMDPAQMDAYWDEMETQVKPLMELAAQK